MALIKVAECGKDTLSQPETQVQSWLRSRQLQPTWSRGVASQGGPVRAPVGKPHYVVMLQLLNLLDTACSKHLPNLPKWKQPNSHLLMI